MKYKSRADLLIAAGESIKMQESAGISPMQKYKHCYVQIVHNGSFFFGDKLDGNEFPLAVVEGKPVFVGDELYGANGRKFAAHHATNEALFDSDNVGGYLNNCSWLPPKPRTVMVELLREDAEFWTGAQYAYVGGALHETSDYNKASNRFYKAVQKSLEAK